MVCREGLVRFDKLDCVSPIPKTGVGGEESGSLQVVLSASRHAVAYRCMLA